MTSNLVKSKNQQKNPKVPLTTLLAILIHQTFEVDIVLRTMIDVKHIQEF